MDRSTHRRITTGVALSALALSLTSPSATARPLPAATASPAVSAATSTATNAALTASAASASATAAVPNGRLAPRAQGKRLRIKVLSNRADLLSGGDALIEVALPQGVQPSHIKVFAGSRNVTPRFATRPNGRYQGRVNQLRVGATRLKVRAGALTAARTLTNHPNGGPIFAGPQLDNYTCQVSAQDAQCNQPAAYSLLYKSTNPAEPGLQPYDQDDPPTDVDTAETDEGRSVPFIVRREDGFQDRDKYSVLALYTPGEKWKPWAPQPQWNRKVLVTHGGNCGASYTPGEPRLDDYAGTIPAFPGYTQSYVTALGRGFMVASTALNNTGHQCNLPQQAESMMMVKERIVERYGPIRYTIGTGCSGGAIAQHTIANAYPGIYQGLVTTCSYPDVLTAGAQFTDYHLMRLYFEDPSRWGPAVLWTERQMAAAEGHISILNGIAADEALYKTALNPEADCPGTTDPVANDTSTRFDSEINPGGVRCSVLDMMINTLGARPKAAWSASEQAAGRGFGGVPIATQGILYGLKALEDSAITPAQFVDLNLKVGGLDVNSDLTAERMTGNSKAIKNAYRTGLINDAANLSEVAIINHGGPDPGIAHDYAHAFWTEDRLFEAQGHTDNRVMWFGTTPLIGDLSWAEEAFIEMDRWLAAVEADTSSAPLARKIIDDKPADLTDRCQDIPGVELTGTPGEPVCRAKELQLHLSTPREVAGDEVTNDRVACRLTPLTQEAFAGVALAFTEEQWASLEALFDGGICDYSRPGRKQGRVHTWLTYADAQGRVIEGGAALPPAPARSATGWASPSFKDILR